MAQVEVVMPKMGESVMEGTVLTWHKQIGENIEADEILLEIGTDKVDSEIPSPVGGKLAAILVPEGETVEVGTPIALIETDVHAAITAPPPAAPVPSPPSVHLPASTPPPEPSAPIQKVSVSGGDTSPVLMPKMGESVMEGTVLTWHKKVGERIEADETLLEIGTDKVDSEIPSPVAGILAQIVVPEGETVEVGTLLAIIAIGNDATVSTTAPTPTPTAKPTTPISSPAPPVVSGQNEISRIGSDGRFYSPLVREMAKVEGLSAAELATLPGSGHEGRVTKKDLTQYLSKKTQAPPASIPETVPTSAPIFAKPPAVTATNRTEIVEMDRMRQIIADHMVRSKATSAHVTSFAEVDVTHLVKLREKNKKTFAAREGVALTYTPFFVYAAIEALKAFPWLNASVEGKQVILKKDYHIGIAVALENAGLIVPCIRNAGTMNLVGLAHSVAQLADRARNKQLLPDELQGGTFTVTNVGSLGSIMGTPIINQPQVGILATGVIKKRPVVIETPDMGDVIAIRHMVYLSLTYDHRIVDGAMGTAFLRKVTEVLENIDPNATL
ncbi:MAG: 2-oxoglutarate dehydrogenase, E2 component, dihydrolipoamide succinyltransferase [Bacteroidetes Order II. Incertae sedis bacterium]|nr:2-oxoglutarate dehydrogenase, E2 component, dihydrolipoamide succinyltransferase [Bacteroidetes Order II. bacterium]